MKQALEVLTLKQARNLTGKTQTDIARAIGVCLATYRKYEENPGTMTISQARIFCREVGQPPERISFGL
jgi:DNA-binding XRE family transcriptional regulator